MTIWNLSAGGDLIWKKINWWYVTKALNSIIDDEFKRNQSESRFFYLFNIECTELKLFGNIRLNFFLLSFKVQIEFIRIPLSQYFAQSKEQWFVLQPITAGAK